MGIADANNHMTMPVALGDGHHGHLFGRTEVMKRRIMTQVRDELQAIRDSCLEGMDGSWQVNDEGLEAMAAGIETVAGLLGVELVEYRPEEEKEEDDEE